MPRAIYKKSKSFTRFDMIVIQSDFFMDFAILWQKFTKIVITVFKGAVGSLLPKQEFGIIWAKS